MYNSIYLKVEISLISQIFMEFEVLTSRTKLPKKNFSFLFNHCL